MSSHLLAIWIGPVQEFIAAARRTRDLWYGSNLLSEISKAVARSIQLQGGKLIFPAPENPSELEPDSDLNVANVILAELVDLDPVAIASQAREAARNHWKEEAASVFKMYQSFIRSDIWNAQIDDVIEFDAAWVPLGDDYQQARRRVMRLLDGRKHGRDFLPAKGQPGIPKSSLDGLRESVLKPSKEWPEQTGRSLRLLEGEHLDVVGIVKRTGGGKRSYPSVARVAADPWIRGLVNGHGQVNLNRLIEACEALGSDKIHRLDVTDRGQPRYAAFPFEGTAVFRSRYPDLKDEANLSPEEIKNLGNRLAGLTRLAGEPSPYLAVLVADGDRLGKALSAIKSADDHQTFSRKLSQFAEEARAIVNQHSGVLVYAGGDDVLAFLPADLALGCARQLHEQFGELMKPWSDEAGKPLTLSVGLAIAHFMDNLEDLLEYGRDAERHAKKSRVEVGPHDERDGLAVHAIKRGGDPVEMRGKWSDNPDDWLIKLAKLQISDAIPGRVAYDLHRVADVYENWQDQEQVAAAIRRDVLRIIKSKQPRESGGLEAIKELLPDRVFDATSLRRLADEILIARQIATAIRQGEGRKPDEEVTS
jgi:CRISPR-associated protein Cmr2